MSMMQAFLFLMGGCPAPGMRLYNAVNGALLSRQPLPGVGGVFSFDVAALGLAVGSYQLGVSAVNTYGCESDRELIQVNIGSGGEVDLELIPPQELVASAEAGGAVRIEWVAFEIGNGDEHAEPAEFELAIPSAATTPAAVVSWNSAMRFGYLFNSGEVGRYYARSSDGIVNGQRGEWVATNSVTPDSTGPPAPAIDMTVLPEGCGCD